MPNWKRVIVSGSSAHLNHVTASGHISGSSTSTGSFGSVHTAGRVGIGTTDPTAPLHIKASGEGNPHTNALYCYNSTNSSGQDAIITARVGGSSGGDPILSLDVYGIDGWSVGLDNSDSDKFKISNDWNDIELNTKLTIDTSGNVGIGTTSPDDLLHLQVDGSATQLRLTSYRNDVGQTAIKGYKARGSLATPVIVQDDDTMLEIQAYGHDGTDWHRVGEIDFQVDGSPSDGTDMPGRIVFSTTADGSGSPTERMRIDSSGNVGIGTESPDTLLELEQSNTTAVAHNAPGPGINIHNTGGANAISALTFTGAGANNDGCLAGIYAKHTNVSENSEQAELHIVTTHNEALVDSVVVSSAGNATFAGTITGKTNASNTSSTIGGDFSGCAFYTDGGDIGTGRIFFRGDSGSGDELIGINNEGSSNDRLVIYNYTSNTYMLKLDYSGNATFIGACNAASYNGLYISSGHIGDGSSGGAHQIGGTGRTYYGGYMTSYGGSHSTAGSIGFHTGGTASSGATTERIRIDTNGHFIPQADNSYNLGSSGNRWANLYVADAHYSNVGTGGNDVDGTEGSWTIQEGEEDLFAINRKTGKKFKIKLEVV